MLTLQYLQFNTLINTKVLIQLPLIYDNNNRYYSNYPLDFNFIPNIKQCRLEIIYN